MKRQGHVVRQVAFLLSISLALLQTSAFASDLKIGAGHPKSPRSTNPIKLFGDVPTPPPEDKGQLPKPEYIPGELVVKLKEGTDPSALAELNQKFGVASSQVIFRKTEDPHETLKLMKKRLADLAPGHPGWYWWSQQDSKETKYYEARLAKEKERLERQIQAEEGLVDHLDQRQMRAPAGASARSLDQIYLLKTSKEVDMRGLVTEYSGNPSVTYAEPNYIVRSQMIPNDHYYQTTRSWTQNFDDLWGIKKIGCERAWDISQGDGVIVAVVDTGVMINHEDLAANIWVNTGEIPGNGIDDDNNGYKDDVHGWNFVENNNNVNDDVGHGTHVSGTIAAVGNNSVGVIGIAPRAKIMPVRALGADGGSTSGLAQALKYATDNGADVANNSWGGSGTSQLLEDAFAYAAAHGMVCTAAAGNSNLDAAGFTPANISSVITVGATTQTDAKTSFSNFGWKVDVGAPGGGDHYAIEGDGAYRFDIYNILSCMPDTGAIPSEAPDLQVAPGYWRLAGTSMACPHVTGEVASILGKFPTLSVDEVKGRVIGTTDPYPSTDMLHPMGSGRINVYKALMANPSPALLMRDASAAESAGDGDGILDPGEQFKVTVQLDNVWRQASSVIATLSSTSPYVASIPTNQANFGSMAHAEKKRNSTNPFVVQLGTKFFSGETPISMTLTVTADGTTQTFQFPIRLGVREIAKAPLIITPPAISGNRAIWLEYREGEDTPTTFAMNMMMCDLATGVVSQLRTVHWGDDYFTGYPHESLSFIPTPSISGDRLAFEDFRNGAWGIYVYNFTTGQEQQLNNTGYSNRRPVIDGTRVVWQSFRDRNYFGLLQMRDMANGDNRVVRNLDSDSSFSISGNCIAFNEWRIDRPGWNIYRYDVAAQTINPVTSSGVAYNPVVSGNRIIWRDLRNSPSGDKPEAWVYDLTAMREFPLTQQHPFAQWNPTISGTWAVYLQEDQEGGLHARAYDFLTNSDLQLSSYPGAQVGDVVGGTSVMWLDTGNNTLYFLKLKPVINQPPVMTSIPDKVAITGQMLSFKVLVTDPDGDPLTYSTSSLPAGAQFNTATQMFTWTPAMNQTGEYQISFTVTDGQFSDTRTVKILAIVPVCPLRDNPFFVRQQYMDFLNRNPDPAGYNFWLFQLNSGQITRARLILGFYNSAEYQNYEAYVVRGYTMLARRADLGGVLGWTQALKAGQINRLMFVNALINSPEFQSRFGPLTNAAFVRCLYLSTLRREPDVGGWSAWTFYLNYGYLSRAQVAQYILESGESIARNANDVLVQSLYLRMLRRTGENSGFWGWLNWLAAGATPLDIINGFLNSKEYKLRFGCSPNENL